ncbi:MAG: hypothetical protein IJU40_08020, partial [Desulfovibrionaceae bacterium]|nr:hypothetical protein [Desulfovibrionaceae bacterium]
LCASCLVCLLTALTCISEAYAGNLVITCNNYYNHSVAFAFARENGYKISDNTTVGWYVVPARSTKTFKIFNYTPNDNYYWFAQVNRKPIINAKDFAGWILYGPAFKSVGGRKLGGGTRVGFKVLHEKQGRANINIGKR